MIRSNGMGEKIKFTFNDHFKKIFEQTYNNTWCQDKVF